MTDLNLKISSERIERLIHFSIIAIAGLSTVLRPSADSKLTLFRIILPALFLWLFMVNTKRGLKFTGIAFFFLLYSGIVSYLSRFDAFSIVFNLYYVTTIFFYFYYKEALKKLGATEIYGFLEWVYKVLIVLGFVQLIFGGVYFNTQNRLPAINIFFWNENEFSSVLAIFTPLFFLSRKSVLKYLWILLAAYLIVYNDAKLALLSMTIFFLGYLVLKFRLFRFRYVGLTILSILALFALFFIRNFIIEGNYTVGFFISRLVEHVFSQEPLEHIGSFNSRTNAVVLGIKEFIDSYFLGIGPGNSLLMMDEVVIPGMEAYGALSMHNFTLQIITEIGLLGLFFMYVFYLKVKSSAQATTKYSRNLIYIFYLSCIVSITLLSGAWSNYFYLFILFYSIDFFRYDV